MSFMKSTIKSKRRLVFTPSDVKTSVPWKTVRLVWDALTECALSETAIQLNAFKKKLNLDSSQLVDALRFVKAFCQSSNYPSLDALVINAVSDRDAQKIIEAKKMTDLLITVFDFDWTKTQL